ncbi:apoptosis-associated speck-like protein containing a CARD [Carcharodon carcharias]|uniref:apoptosis-associated speck-like protein containing a CARD n=1 Tax=Carcharodon carcharias TaxID=13397 RepID=UPI001B7E809D|nr:apoptosis-associated speck-like protein containing a CARD [Carcharodon carcharias]
MSRTVRQCIVDALDELGKEDFARFKADLREVSLMPTFRKIPWGKLEGAGKLEAAKLMVDFYRDVYAGELAVQVLKGMHQQEAAVSLEGQLSAASQTPATQTPASQPIPPAVQNNPGIHPVDKYFTHIVQGFSSVDCVLDSLMAKGVVTSENYDKIRSLTPRQEKMRQLLIIIRGQGPKAKEQLWEDMKEWDKYFTDSLMQA